MPSSPPADWAGGPVPAVGTGARRQPAGGGPTALEALAEEASTCTSCGLVAGRTTVVFGAGLPTTDLMFVGEGSTGRASDCNPRVVDLSPTPEPPTRGFDTVPFALGRLAQMWVPSNTRPVGCLSKA